MVLLMMGVRRLQYHEFAEAGFVVGSALIRLRRVIRDQIHAQDVAAIIRLAESREHLCAIVSDNAEALGFLSLELCRVDDPDHAPARFPAIPGRGPWRLEYPVHIDGNAEAGEHGPWVLRLWCHQENGFRLMGTERAVLILADAIHHWGERGLRSLAPARAVSPARFPGAGDVRAVS
jgi:hypothetical protein